jgi:rhamnosyltransferase
MTDVRQISREARERIIVVTQLSPRVAILLATHNGAQFIDAQLTSLCANSTPFTVHWIDDHSTDHTQDVVRAAASRRGIDIVEWHRPKREGVPNVFFRLLESVEADIYLFCDQDDIWQPGKIDATVAHLLPDLASPALCFSDPLIFADGQPERLQRNSDVRGVSARAGLKESSLFTYNPAAGTTIGFTRPLREIFLPHKEIARGYAFMHDWWMYLIALASGTARLLPDVPTTLRRIHVNNTLGVHQRRLGIEYFVSTWRIYQKARRWFSRQAQGFCLAAATLPGAKVEHLLMLAKLVATLDRRQSPAALIRLARRRALPSNWERIFWLAATCACRDAPPVSPGR